MEYPLAKRLKDAGYPQPDIRHRVPHPAKWVREKAEAGHELAYAPYIIELMRACKLPIDLYGQDDNWGAETPTGDYGHGVDPEEAMANLWIALNPK